jgi:RNA polymerase sigma-70 factor (ECF subfamily)
MGSLPQEQILYDPTFWKSEKDRSGDVLVADQLRSGSDEEAMVRLQERDRGAVEVLFHRYSRLVFSIALDIVHDRGDAEDVTQEAFFYIYQKADLYDPARGTVKGWILQVAYHRALDRRAYLHRRPFNSGTDIESLGDTLVGDTDLDREVGITLSRIQLEKAFQELPELQRRTLELFYFEGMKLREISKVLNEPWGNIRHHFYRGLEGLRKSAFVERLREK